ncbi:UvrD-like helicase family protein [Pseudonocardia sediminis]|uniref:DNA 3'-5' helicase n=1 Tax=Pseudonocardia sediminis TaxID=1397368 RepID=A0A4Q7UVL4_PSEST|nr:UvrD-like helicase family protein [Pseudonocardia sediminis]
MLDHDHGPLRVLGGPGTGKTTLLLEAVARRIREGVPPENLLFLVGSRRAATQLRDRLIPMLAPSGPQDGTGLAARTSRELLVRTVHSYAFGVLRLHAAQHEDPPPRLLASAEQDVVVRELLAGEIANWNGSVPGSGWPERLDPALGLPGFAAELRELLLRAAERGLGPDELDEIGRTHGRDEWVAAATFFRTYEQVILLRGAAGRGAPQATAPALDSAELVSAALDALAADPELRARERARVRHLLVDDAQDLDPQQMELVRVLAGSAQVTLLAGDPDQAVLTFRGADPQGLNAVDAPSEVLTVDHRQTDAVRAAGARLAGKLPGAGPGRNRRGPDTDDDMAEDVAGPPDPAEGIDPAGPAVDDGIAPDGSGPEPSQVGERPAPSAAGSSPGGTSAPAPSAPAPSAAASSTADGSAPDPSVTDSSAADPEGAAVQVRVFGSAAAEAGWIADRLRRAHLVDGVPWAEMAVLSRSARRTLPALRRALAAAGVPIAAPPDELPLSRQPAVVPLLLILRGAGRPSAIDADLAVALLTSPLGSGDPMRMRRLRRGLLRLHAAGSRATTAPEDSPGSGDEPSPGDGRAPGTGDGFGPAAGTGDGSGPAAGIGDGSAEGRPVGAGDGSASVVGPGGAPGRATGSVDGVVPVDRDTDAGPASPTARVLAAVTPFDGSDVEAASSDPLLVEALRAAASGSPDPLVALPAAETAPLRDIGALLDTAARTIAEGQSVEEVLWRVWRRTTLARRWSEASARGGPAGAAADRDLDAVMALFDAAARYTDRLPGADVAGFLDYIADQQLPGDTLADQAPRDTAVELTTAHSARGREWRVVAVPSVQEGQWPDLRLRGSLLGNEQLVDLVAGVAEPDATVSRVAPLLAEERRLFYVACTRAKESLLVSGIQGEDEQPSRFLDELDPRPADATEARAVHRPGRSLVLPELVGELRRVVAVPDHGVPDLAARRRRAATQLARLAADGVPGAHPDDWYGLADLSSGEPLRAPGELVPVSPSDVETIASCPLRWVLQRHGGDETSALSAVTGSLVHALVQAKAAGADPSELESALRSAWARLDAGAPWFGRRELERVRAMLAAFDEWVRDSREQGLSLVAVEQPMQLDLDGDHPDDPDPEEAATAARRVRLRGRVDRLETDAQGRPVVVDVKTGKTATPAKQAAEHPQLAVYQLAASLGAFDDLVGSGVQPGGARLVFLADRKATGAPKEPSQEPLDTEAAQQWRDVVLQCADDASGAVFVARVGPDCDRCPVRTSCPAVEPGRSVLSD